MTRFDHIPIMTGLRLLLPALLIVAMAASPADARSSWDHGPLEVSADGRTFQYADGTPFFWLGDTAWLITQKLDREEVKAYFENRRAKGFNVVQCCVVQFLTDTSFNGSPAVRDGDIATLHLTPGSDPSDPAQYDYWDHVDYVVDTAAAHGIHLAIAPVWSHMVRRTPLSAAQVRPYIEQVAARYRDRPNIIWLNGGSGRGHENTDVWQMIGETLQRQNPHQLVSYHPFGRTVTTEWFADAAWIDFHMFTSGHRRYDQDTEGRKYGEDNWRYVLEARAADPKRPVLDAEPAYENTPQGLHKPEEPYWTADDARRYAYWSVFAGAAGHTYGENSVRQVYLSGEARPASGAKGFFMDSLDTDGARQMAHLKALMMSRPLLGRVNDQSLVANDEGEKYERVLVTRGASHLFAYTYTGREFALSPGALTGDAFTVRWFNPRTGETTSAGTMARADTIVFNPPGEPAPGRDWVLVLDDAARGFPDPAAADSLRPRLIVTTDFPPLDVIPGGAGHGPAEKRSDPDDIQSMVRLLLYANDLEIEGLVASAGTFANVASKQHILDLLGLYDQVDENLRQRDARYPTADRLRTATWQGASGTWGKPVEEIVGEGRDTEASDAIIRIVDRPDPRPVWVGVWGGSADLAQAIWTVRKTRTPSELQRFLGQLRIFMIGLGDKTGQDGSGQWLLDTFPELFIVVSQATYTGMFAQGSPLGDLAWLDTHVREGHGPLGAAYPRSGFNPGSPGMQEGDTPTFLHLVSALRGLNDAERPDQPGWGGQYVRRDPARNHWFDGPGAGSVRRWLPEIQADFARRADWMLPPGASQAASASAQP